MRQMQIEMQYYTHIYPVNINKENTRRVPPQFRSCVKVEVAVLGCPS